MTVVGNGHGSVSYTHLRAHETDSYLVCRLLLEKKKFGVENRLVNPKSQNESEETDQMSVQVKRLVL